MPRPDSGAHWSTDFVEHVRTVHFTLIGVCAALLVLSMSRTQSEVQVAHQQIRQIQEFIGMSQPYGKLLLPDWLKDGARARLNEWAKPRFPNLPRSVTPQEANAVEFSLHGIKYQAPVTFDEQDGYRWDWKLRGQGEGMVTFWEHRRLWERLSQSPKSLEEFRAWWDISRQVFLDVPEQLYYNAYAFEVVSPPKFTGVAPGQFPGRFPWGFVPVKLTLLKDIPGSSPTKGLNDLFFRDYSEQEIKDLQTSDPSFREKQAYTGTLYCSIVGSTEKKDVTLSMPVSGFGTAPYDAQSVLLSHAKPEWDWKHGTFDYSFRELSDLTKDYEGMSFDVAERVLAGEEKRGGETFEVVGVKLPAESITRWGIFSIIAIQIYLWIHLRELSPRLRRNDPGWDVAWIGVYTSSHARIVMFALTCLLPAAAVLSVGIRGLYISSFAKTNWVLLIAGAAVTSALGILAWKRLPRMTERHGEHPRV